MKKLSSESWLYVVATLIICIVVSYNIISGINESAKERIAYAEEESYSDGYNQGYEDGYDSGYDFGYSEGSSSGYDEGYDDGKEGNLSPADKRTVYVTPSGRKYHRKSCSSIKGHDTEKLQTWEAKERSYTACSRCNP